MAQQAANSFEPTPLRNVASADAIRAGSGDNYRASGFKSAAVDTIGNQPAATSTPATPTAGTGTATLGGSTQTQNLTPGMLAALNAGPHSPTGAKDVAGAMGAIASFGSGIPFLGSAASALTNKNADPLATALLGPLGGNLFKHNRPYIQDIYAALSEGRPVTDADWAKAGYGPNGAAMSAAPQPQPAGGLRAFGNIGTALNTNTLPVTGLRSI